MKEENINNVNVITADMNDFSIDKKFDRVVSIEMFEHMRNYQVLLERISNWLVDDGKLFVHIFTHKDLVYPFEDSGDGDWMAREFFSGGIMPSHKLLLHFSRHMGIESMWKVSGTHYSKTSLAWLKMMDKNKAEILNIFSKTYGQGEEGNGSRGGEFSLCHARNSSVLKMELSGEFLITGLLKLLNRIKWLS